jgi:hypothetical protein
MYQKYFKLICAATIAFAAAATSCKKDNDVETLRATSLQITTITASAPDHDTQTKVALEGTDKNQLKWKVGDRVYVAQLNAAGNAYETMYSYGTYQVANEAAITDNGKTAAFTHVSGNQVSAGGKFVAWHTGRTGATPSGEGSLAAAWISYNIPASITQAASDAYDAAHNELFFVSGVTEPTGTTAQFAFRHSMAMVEAVITSATETWAVDKVTISMTGTTDYFSAQLGIQPSGTIQSRTHQSERTVTLTNGNLSASTPIKVRIPLMCRTFNIPAGAKYVITVHGKGGQSFAVEKDLIHLVAGNIYRVPIAVGAPLEDGTEANPFRVKNLADLQKVATETTAGGWTRTAHYLQTANIDLNSIANWTPIGGTTQATAFMGVYDGGGFTISNLKITSGNDKGLFAGLTSASGMIKNVRLTIGSIVGGRYVGGIVAYMHNGTIENCHVSGGSITGVDDVGGIAGNASNANCIVRNCHVVGTGINVSGDVMYGCSAGGVVGSNLGMVQECYATGAVSRIAGGSFDNGEIGGVVGTNRNGATIQRSFATGNVSSVNRNVYAGGVVGSNSGTVRSCYATGTVTDNQASGSRLGGLVGDNTGTMQHCYATGAVSKTATTGTGAIGGIAGYGNNVSRCVALNPSINAASASTSIGRVAGYDFSSATANYSRQTGMTVTRFGATVNPSFNTNGTGADGASATAAQTHGASSNTWWSGTVQFPSADWDFRTNGLPTLKGFAGVTQNPTVQ